MNCLSSAPGILLFLLADLLFQYVSTPTFSTPRLRRSRITRLAGRGHPLFVAMANSATNSRFGYGDQTEQTCSPREVARARRARPAPTPPAGSSSERGLIPPPFRPTPLPKRSGTLYTRGNARY